MNFTILTAEKQTLMTKVLSLDNEGKLQKSTRAKLYRGYYQVHSANDLDALAELLDSLNPNQCVTWGRPDTEQGVLCTQDDHVQRAVGAIPRNREHFKWAHSAGVLMLDHDGIPGRSLSRDDFRNLLVEACPALASAPMLWRPSVSAGCVDADGRVLTALDRHRLYVPVSDPRLIPEAGEALQALLWAAGFGWCEVSVSGQRLLRCAVDTSVWQPERIDFCAKPSLKDGIQRPQAKHHIYGDSGALFDLQCLIDAADVNLKDRSKSAQRQARKAMDETAHETSLRWATERAPALAQRRAVSNDRAMQCLVRAATNRTLMGDYELTTSEGSVITVGDMLDAPAAWHGKRFYDPLDPDNDGRVAVARLFGTRPTIYSHRHGGVVFELRRQTARIQLGRGMRIEATDGTLGVLRERGELYDFGTAAVAYVTGAGRVVVPNRNWLTDHIGRACEFYRMRIEQDKEGNITGEKELPEDPPGWLADTILAKHGERGFAMITGVITAPTLRPDGSALDNPGYDLDTQLEYVPVSTYLPRIPATPTPEAAAQALRRLFEPFRKFPFADAESVGVFLAALVSACLRPSLPTCPGFGFDAPAAGSGKTLLAQCIGWLSTGEDASVLPPTRDEEETRKRLFAALLSGARVLLWDNVREPLGNAAMDAFLTSPSFADRVLGKSETSALPNRAMFLVTGNNLVLSGDTFRRILLCRIDPRSETPYKREFEQNPLEYVKEHRLTMVCDALTAARAWITAGRPRAVSGNTASFEHWDALVRQPMMWLAPYAKGLLPDYSDPLTGVERASSTNPENAMLNALLTALQHQFGSRPATAKEMVTAAESDADLREALEDLATPTRGRAISTKTLGKWLAAHIGQIVRGKRLQRLNGQGGTFRWKVEILNFVGGPQTHLNPPNQPEPADFSLETADKVGLVGLSSFVSASRPIEEG